MTVLALDLATKTGWALGDSRGLIQSGTEEFKTGRFESHGMRFIRFRAWLAEMIEVNRVQLIAYEEVRRHLSTDAAHMHGGLLAIMQAVAIEAHVEYTAYPVGTIKKHATGKGSANKNMMVAAACERWPGFSGDDNEADARWILDLHMKGTT